MYIRHGTLFRMNNDTSENIILTHVIGYNIVVGLQNSA
jgi:hypothetical protein